MRLGQLLQRSGDLDGAEQAYRHVLELDPNSKVARDCLDALAASRAASLVSATRSPAPVERMQEATVPNIQNQCPAPSEMSPLPQLAGRLRRWLRRSAQPAHLTLAQSIVIRSIDITGKAVRLPGLRRFLGSSYEKNCFRRQLPSKCPEDGVCGMDSAAA